jgi:hypothetical protein
MQARGIVDDGLATALSLVTALKSAEAGNILHLDKVMSHVPNSLAEASKMKVW